MSCSATGRGSRTSASGAERELARRHRNTVNTLLQKMKQDSNDLHNLKLQLHLRQQMEKRERLLASLSSYNYKFSFKQACRKRYGTTCSWITHNKEFNDWLNDSGSSLFWCHGIPGSGKTVLTQCLNADQLSIEIETQLERLSLDPPDMEDLCEFFENVLPKLTEQFIVIDGIDEYHRVSLTSEHVNSDIQTYIEDVIAEKKETGELIVGQQQLLTEIKSALLDGAQGMFLWVFFQIQNICEQKRDADIRRAIRNLPKDLPETYERILRKIEDSGTSLIAQRVFKWAAAAKRPLSVEEMREAIAVEPCQPSRDPSLVLNDIDRLSLCCRNLIAIDEEERVVQFAHHTVRQFLLAEISTPSLKKFHFKLEEADHNVGEVCVTYLNFSDFKRQVEKIRSSGSRPVDPLVMLKMSLTSLSGHFDIATNRRWMSWLQRRKAQNLKKVDFERVLRDVANLNNLESTKELSSMYALLPYASEHWLLHTSHFAQGKIITWNSWCRLLSAEDTFTCTPWTIDEWNRRDQKVLRWAIQNNHCALLRYLEGSGEDLGLERWRSILIDSARNDDSKTIDGIIEFRKVTKMDLSLALREEAAAGGHLAVVGRLLAAGADVNAASQYYGQTALQVAAARAGFANYYHVFAPSCARGPSHSSLDISRIANHNPDTK
ncbi:hypothetical protein M432DRAFT_587466 [Thermoascus aurantiacus ATCC 26904]